MKHRITVTVDEGLIAALDELVQAETFESRSAAVEAAVQGLMEARAEARYEEQLGALSPLEEQAMADEGMEDWTAMVLGDNW